MNRNKAEKLIFEKLLEIVEIYKKYRPGGRYISMSYCDDLIAANNRYWEDDEDRPINFTVLKEHGKWNWKEEQSDYQMMNGMLFFLITKLINNHQHNREAKREEEHEIF